MTKTIHVALFALLVALLAACGGSSNSSSATLAPSTPPTDGTHPNEDLDPEDGTPPAVPVAGDGEIQVLSNRADLISGGDALIRVVAANSQQLQGGVTFTINDETDATDALVLQEDGSLLGLVSGLTLGENTLVVKMDDDTVLERTLINHPKGGPIFSGPQVQPWRCTNGDAQLDEQCNQAPEYSFKYLPADALASFADNMQSVSERIKGPEDIIDVPIDFLKIGFSGQELENYDPEDPPAIKDIAEITTDTGVTMPFIVRVERGVINRDRYQIMTLFNPEESWTALNQQPQWNKKLLIHHGSNVGVEYGMANPSNTEFGNGIVVALSRGFITLSTAQSNLGHNANLVTGAESLVMAKEHIIEQYGPLRYSIGTGCSGGAIMQLQVANAFPGIYQGLIVQCAYPDVWTTAVQFADYHLLNKKFNWTLPSGPEDVALMLSGLLADPGPVPMISFYGHLPINPIASDAAFFPAAFPEQEKCRGIEDPSILYHPEDNPEGLRCGLVDWMHNQFDVRTSEVWGPVEELISNGFTGTPFDNTGVQYGLEALQQGLISGATFLEINREIGGLDIDFQHQSERSQADDKALEYAYRTGAINTAEHLNEVPIIDLRGLDPGAAHDAYHSWQLRARLEATQEDPHNHVIWFGPVPVAGDTAYTAQALLVMDEWLSNVEKAEEDMPLSAKIRQFKPVQARDRCLSVTSAFDDEHIPPLLGPLTYPNPVIPYLDLSKIPAAPAQLGKITDAVTNQVCGLSLESITDISELLDLPDDGAISGVLSQLTRPIDQILKPITDLQSTVTTTRFGTPRTMAGEDIRTLNNKCQLKPVDPADYATAPFLSLTDPAGLAKELAGVFTDGVADPTSFPDIIGGLLPSFITNPTSVIDNLTGLFEAGVSDPTSLPESILATLAATITPDPAGFAKKVEEIFPHGVCDYSKPPVSAVATETWLQYGNAESVVYGGGKLNDDNAQHSRHGWASPNFNLVIDSTQ